MLTYLPLPDFAESAKVLDDKRLGIQRAEVLQIVNALDKSQDKGWKHHPGTKMWEGYPTALINYGLMTCTEWISRGFKDSVYDKLYDRFLHGLFTHTIGPNGLVADNWTDLSTGILPPWVGREDVHASHRAILLGKNPEWYGQFGWTEEPRKQPVWPV